MRKLVAIAASCWLLGLVGCTGSGGDPGPAEQPDTWADREFDSVSIDSFEVVANPSNNLSRYIEWETTPASSATVDVDCGDEYAPTFETTLTADGEVFLMGLWNGATCDVTLEVTRDQATETATREITVESLPDFLPELTAEVSKPDQMQQGWTAFNLNNSFDDVPLIIAMVDAEGRYRWYHQRDTSGSGAATSVTPMDQGLLVGGTFDTGRIWPAIIGWDGELVWEEELDMHHDIRPWGEESVLYLGHANNCPDNIPGSSSIVEWDRSSGEEVWRWDFCQHYTPSNPRVDWDHTNAIEPFPDEDALMISARNQSAIFKVDRSSKEVEWRLGVDGDFDRVANTSEAMFLRQHAPEIQPNGNVLLFDNGSNGRPFSRAVEFSYDTDSMTMELVWEYRPDPDIYAPIWSDADRLENGNTLATFGRRQEDNFSVIQEVTPDKEVVWDLRTPDKWGWYRSHRIADPPSGMVR